MHFTANKSVTVKDLQYNGTKLEWVNNFKYLGVTFNKPNSFTDGIEELCQHACKQHANSAGFAFFET